MTFEQKERSLHPLGARFKVDARYAFAVATVPEGLRMRYVLLSASLLAGCASTAPTKIGADTYYSSPTNTAGAFGNPGAIAGGLMADGNRFCAKFGKEFELVTQQVDQPRVAQSLGGASITFKCVDHAASPVMRPDNGVTTITK